MNVDKRFVQDRGSNIFDGCELLIKGALETEGGVQLLTGYPGSPIARYFDCIAEIKELLRERGIFGNMANNEAISAAMVNGSQMAPIRAITAMKSVGVHVASDGLALGNLAGTHPEGGVIVIYGDDPWNESTQVPADSRFISRHLRIPVMEPATPQEVKDWIDLGFKLSNRGSLYIGYVITTLLADGGGTVECRPNHYPALNTRYRTAIETDHLDVENTVLLPPRTSKREADIPERFERLLAAARELGVNRIENRRPDRARLGFIVSGAAYQHLQQALVELDLLGEFPIFKVGISYPIDPLLVAEFAASVDNVCIVEERRSFVEEQVGQLLLRDAQDRGFSTKLWGKRFPGGIEGFPSVFGLNSSICITKVTQLLDKLDDPHIRDGRQRFDTQLEIIADTARAKVEIPNRTPTFCPGCPHRDSAAVFLALRKRLADPVYTKKKYKCGPMDLVFHGETGCHTMLMFPPTEPLMHNYSGMGIGGGTGAGIDPFITNKQIVFLGDGTFFHSGVTAVSNSIKQNQDITYVILQNDTTAMTGHQPHAGVTDDLLGTETFAQDIEHVVRGLAAIPGAPDHSHCSIARMNPADRANYEGLVERTVLAKGVKVIIADKECGITYQRRLRVDKRREIASRGFLVKTTTMNVTPEVCEFCLECTRQTGCPGLNVENTDYGEKIVTDLSWCVNDAACARIEACPSFEEVTIRRNKPPRPRGEQMKLVDLPEPTIEVDKPVWRAYLAGVGGMGIGSAAAVLVRAGHRQGYRVLFADKKGLAIRNGGVFSQVIFCQQGVEGVSQMIPFGKADLLLGVDILEATRAVDPKGPYRVASPDRTATVVNTDKTPTILSLMGRDSFDVANLEKMLRARTADGRYFGHRITNTCERLFGTKLYANVTMMGVAFQRGLIPVSSENVLHAIEEALKGDRRQNLRAFNLGRKLVADPELFSERREPRTLANTVREKAIFLSQRRLGRRRALRRERVGRPTDPVYRLPDTTDSRRYKMLVFRTLRRCRELERETRRDVAIRIYDLMKHTGYNYARQYAETIGKVFLAESTEQKPDNGFPITRSVVWNLAKLMTIKDEFYVAHLLTSSEKKRRDRQRYNVVPSNGDRIRYRRTFHPRILGQKIGIRVPNWGLYVLRELRWLRKFLPGYHREDRRFCAWYRTVIDRFCESGFPTDPRGHELFHQAIGHVDAVNGYREYRTPKMVEARRRCEEILWTIQNGRPFADVLRPTEARAASVTDK